MFEKKDNRRKNMLILSRLLAIGAIVLVWISRNKLGPERDVYRTIALSLIVGLVIVRIGFAIKPGAFKDKSADPDQES